MARATPERRRVDSAKHDSGNGAHEQARQMVRDGRYRYTLPIDVRIQQKEARLRQLEANLFEQELDVESLRLQLGIVPPDDPSRQEIEEQLRNARRRVTIVVRTIHHLRDEYQVPLVSRVDGDDDVESDQVVEVDHG